MFSIGDSRQQFFSYFEKWKFSYEIVRSAFVSVLLAHDKNHNVDVTSSTCGRLLELVVLNDILGFSIGC